MPLLKSTVYALWQLAARVCIPNFCCPADYRQLHMNTLLGQKAKLYYVSSAVFKFKQFDLPKPQAYFINEVVTLLGKVK